MIALLRVLSVSPPHGRRKYRRLEGGAALPDRGPVPSVAFAFVEIVVGPRYQGAHIVADTGQRSADRHGHAEVPAVDVELGSLHERTQSLGELLQVAQSGCGRHHDELFSSPAA